MTYAQTTPQSRMLSHRDNKQNFYLKCNDNTKEWSTSDRNPFSSSLHLIIQLDSVCICLRAFIFRSDRDRERERETETHTHTHRMSHGYGCDQLSHYHKFLYLVILANFHDYYYWRTFSFICTVPRSFTPSLYFVGLARLWLRVMFVLSLCAAHFIPCKMIISIRLNRNVNKIHYVQVNIYSSILCRHSPIWHVHTHYTLYVFHPYEYVRISNKETKKRDEKFFMFVS